MVFLSSRKTRFATRQHPFVQPSTENTVQPQRQTLFCSGHSFIRFFCVEICTTKRYHNVFCLGQCTECNAAVFQSLLEKLNFRGSTIFEQELLSTTNHTRTSAFLKITLQFVTDQLGVEFGGNYPLVLENGRFNI